MSALTDAGQAELRRFGWTLGPEFERRYLSDPWVFNLANVVEKVAAERDVLIAAITEFADSSTSWEGAMHLRRIIAKHSGAGQVLKDQEEQSNG